MDILWVIISLVLVSIGVLLLILRWGSSVILSPRRRRPSPECVQIIENSTAYGIRSEAFEVSTEDGFQLKAIWLEPSGASITQGIVVMLDGLGGHKERLLPLAQRLIAEGFRCVAYDLRAHGESGARFSTFGFLDRQDLSLVIDRIESLLEERGEDATPVMGFGISMGAATVIQCMPNDQRLTAGVAAAPYTNFHAGMSHAIGRATRGLIPQWLCSLIISLACWRAKIPIDELSPEESASAIQVPVSFYLRAIES